MVSEKSMIRAYSDGELPRGGDGIDSPTPSTPTTPIRAIFAKKAPPKSHWKPDSDSFECYNINCRKMFTFFERKHHCRRCGNIFCNTCCKYSSRLNEQLEWDMEGQKCRVCRSCFLELEELLKSGSSNHNNATDSKPRSATDQGSGLQRRKSTDTLGGGPAAGDPDALLFVKGADSLVPDFSKDDNSVAFFEERRRTREFRERKGQRRGSLQDNYTWSTF